MEYLSLFLGLVSGIISYRYYLRIAGRRLFSGGYLIDASKGEDYYRVKTLVAHWRNMQFLMTVVAAVCIGVYLRCLLQ